MTRLRHSLLEAGLETPLLASVPAPASAARYLVAMQLDRTQFSDDAINALRDDISGLGLVSATEVNVLNEHLVKFSFDLDADIETDELRESLEFLAPGDAIDIHERGNKAISASPPVAQIADDPDGEFGFFAPLPAAAELPLATVSAAAATDADIQLSSLVDATSIRVNVVKVDQLINLVGELVIADRKSVV